MKRILLAMLFAVIISGVALGQGFEPKSYRWNIEPGYMLTFGACDVEGFSEQKSGVGLSIEVRYRMNCGVEIGLYTSASRFDRNYEHLAYEGFKVYNKVQFPSVNIMPTITYNYRVSRFVELFGGAGLGWMYGERGKDTMDVDGLPREDCDCHSVVFMPRVGVKVRNHLRFSLGYKCQEKANSHAFIAVGWTFGIGRINK